MQSNLPVTFMGFVEITDANTGEVLVSKKNGIHFENMSRALALTLSNQGYGHINTMQFGNGASTTSGTGAVTYYPPNTTGANATLYNATYTTKVVDGNSSSNTNPAKNYMTVNHTTTDTYTDIIVNAYLDYGEPSGQDAFDNTSDTETNYVFDELGLVSYPENGSGAGMLLTHVVFHPIQKSLNRAIAITYTVRIYMS